MTNIDRRYGASIEDGASLHGRAFRAALAALLAAGVSAGPVMSLAHACDGCGMPGATAGSGIGKLQGGFDVAYGRDAESDGGERHAASEGRWTSSRAGGHAPIGVMGDHIHEKGEIMLSYRYMFMHMSENRDGTDEVGASEVVDPAGFGFLVSPTRMDMQMHMLGAMYAVTDDLTLMGMIPVISLEMDHITRAGGRFTTKSVGPGDIRVTGLYSLLKRGWHRLHLNAGVSFPTGSIDERDATPMGPNSPLPYPMQLGSGTFDLLPGLTYLGQSPSFSWGLQSVGTVRLGENENDYTLGDQVLVTAWGGRDWKRWLATSLRAEWRWWDDIDGFDPKLGDPVTEPGRIIVPTADPRLRGGQRLDLLFGVNLYGPSGDVKGHRLAVELGLPVFQDLDGPQLETDWIATIGWQYSI